MLVSQQTGIARARLPQPAVCQPRQLPFHGSRPRVWTPRSVSHSHYGRAHMRTHTSAHTSGSSIVALDVMPAPAEPPAPTLQSRVVLTALMLLATATTFALGWLQGSRSVTALPSGRTGWSVTAAQHPAAHRFASITLSSRRGKSATFGADVVVKYNALKLFSLPTVGRLLAVVAMAIPISILGGILYRWATGGDLKDCINKTYTAWANLPGVTITEEQTLPAAVVMHSVFGVGLLTFAVVLGIISEDMSAAFEEVRSGNHSVAEVGHTVVLGSNRHLMPMLRQLAAAMRERQGRGSLCNPVVVLADRDKQELDAEIRELAGEGLEVITRRGKASRMDDLQRVAAGSAGTIIMLHPEDMDQVAASSQKAAALAALSSVGGIQGQTLVVQMWDGAEEADAAQVAYERFTGQNKRGMVQVLGGERISKVMAQCAVQPGLGSVLTDLLQQTTSGSEFYFATCPDQLAGKKYAEVRRHYQHAVPVGVLDKATQKLRLNPSEALVVGAGDRLAFVSLDAKHVGDVRGSPFQAPPLPRVKQAKWGVDREVHRVVVLSFGGGGQSDTAWVVRGLDEFARRRTDITVIQEADIDEAAHRCSVNKVKGSPASLRVLQEAGVAEADSVIITGLQHLSPDDADAQVVASVLQLQRLQIDEGEDGAQHVVAAVSNSDTQDVLSQVTSLPGADAAITVDALSPDDLISGIMTQVAADPSLNTVYGELFGGRAGCELYLRDPRKYGLPLGEAAGALTWAQVMEAARSKGETVIGGLTAGGDILMVQDALAEAPIAPDTRLIAIAESF